jgi:radical SAM protein with 4Fe4S-binding SPASM domain
MCYKDEVDGIKKSFFNYKVFNKLVDDIEKNSLKFKGLKLAWLGEAFLHPEIDRILKFLVNKSFFDILSFDTNCHFLSENVLKSLKNIDKSVFFYLSLDAVKKETYEKIRKGGDFDKVIKNVFNLIEFKKKFGAKFYFRFQFIVQEENINEAEEFVNFWKNKGYKKVLFEENPLFEEDFIFFRKLIAPRDQKKANELFENVKQRFEFKNDNSDSKFGKSENKVKCCDKYWTMPIIRADGSVTCCNLDPEMKLVLGNIKEKKFSDIWVFGEKINLFRKGALKKRFYDKCEKCDNKTCGFSDELIEELMKCLFPN